MLFDFYVAEENKFNLIQPNTVMDYHTHNT